MSLWHKLKFSNPYIFATWCCKPVIFQTQITWYIRIHSLKYLRFTKIYELKNHSLWQRLNSLYLTLPYNNLGNNKGSKKWIPKNHEMVFFEGEKKFVFSYSKIISSVDYLVYRQNNRIYLFTSEIMYYEKYVCLMCVRRNLNPYKCNTRVRDRFSDPIRKLSLKII